MARIRTSITVDRDLIAFADNEVAAGRAGSRSELVEFALREYRDALWSEGARRAASDSEYQASLRAWESSMEDGLPGEDFSDWWDGDNEEAAA